MKLSVSLDSVWILAVTAIIWSDAWFNIANIPWLRSQDPQKRRWIHCPCANLNTHHQRSQRLAVITSVLCGSQTAHPTELQYACSFEIASWNVNPFLDTPLLDIWTVLSLPEMAETSAEGSAPAQCLKLSLRLHPDEASLAAGLLCAGTLLSWLQSLRTDTAHCIIDRTVLDHAASSVSACPAGSKISSNPCFSN